MKEKRQDNFAIIILLVQSTLLAFAGMMFPILYLFFPAMFLRETGKQGIVRVMLIFFGVMGLIGAFFSPSYALMLLTLFGPLILALDYSIRTNQPVGPTMVVATGLVLFSLGFNLYMGDAISQIQSGAFLENIINAQKEILQGTQFSNVEIERFLLQMREAFQLLQMLLPGISLLFSLGLVYFSYSIAGKSRILRGEKVKTPAPFLFMRLPNNMLTAGFVTALALFLVGKFSQLEVSLLSMNLMLVISGLLLFQGLAVLNFYLYRFIPMGIVRGILTGIIIFIPFMQIFLVLIGLFDQWINFRRLRS